MIYVHVSAENQNAKINSLQHFWQIKDSGACDTLGLQIKEHVAPLHITEQPNPSHIKRSYSSTVAQHATLYIGPRARPGTETGPQREIGQIAVRRDRAARARIPPHTVQQATHSTFPRDHRSQRYAFYVCRDERDSFRFSCAPVRRCAFLGTQAHT